MSQFLRWVRKREREKKKKYLLKKEKNVERG
jgi:hypothetical protein